MAADDIETGLTERVWRDPEFAAALAMIGVELSKGVRGEVKIQEPNILPHAGDSRNSSIEPQPRRDHVINCPTTALANETVSETTAYETK